MTAFFPSDAEMMARTFGIVLGAASCNEAVSHDRLQAAGEKMKNVLAVAASSPCGRGSRLRPVLRIGGRRPSGRAKR
jgi:hypothetical protein